MRRFAAKTTSFFTCATCTWDKWPHVLTFRYSDLFCNLGLPWAPLCRHCDMENRLDCGNCFDGGRACNDSLSTAKFELPSQHSQTWETITCSECRKSMSTSSALIGCFLSTRYKKMTGSTSLTTNQYLCYRLCGWVSISTVVFFFVKVQLEASNIVSQNQNERLWNKSLAFGRDVLFLELIMDSGTVLQGTLLHKARVTSK
jgi:hypothetical protein